MDKRERYSRQSSLVLDAIQEKKITIVGAGAIGRNVALQLASMGAEEIEIWDFDTVEESNVASQGFREIDIGKTKVDAVGEVLYSINTEAKIKLLNQKFVKSSYLNPIVFMCVDSMDGREILSSACNRQEIEFAIDGRMQGETARVLCFDPKNKESYNYYRSTLVKDEEAHDGSCTAKTTIYCANIISGFMTSTYAKYLRNSSLDVDFFINIMDNEIFLKAS